MFRHDSPEQLTSTTAQQSQRREALWIFLWFLCTRLVVVLAAHAGARHPKPGFVNEWITKLPYSAFTEPLVRWDAHYYLSIAAGGYPSADHHPVFHAAFFPLYPALIRLLNVVVGDYIVSALILSNLFTLIAAYVVWKWIGSRSREAGFAAALFFLGSPGAEFLSFPYTESLFCLLAALGFWAIEREKIGWAAVAGALVSATRPPGVVIALALGVQGLRHWRDRRALVRYGVAAVIATTGIVLYAAYCSRHYNDALYFSHLQKYWQRDMSLFGPIKAIVERSFGKDFYLITFASIALVVWLTFRERLMLAVSAWFLLLVPLATGTLMSIIRYQAANMPIYAAVGRLFARGWLLWIVLGLSTAFMAFQTYRQAAGFSNF